MIGGAVGAMRPHTDGVVIPDVFVYRTGGGWPTGGHVGSAGADALTSSTLEALAWSVIVGVVGAAPYNPSAFADGTLPSWNFGSQCSSANESACRRQSVGEAACFFEHVDHNVVVIRSVLAPIVADILLNMESCRCKDALAGLPVFTSKSSATRASAAWLLVFTSKPSAARAGAAGLLVFTSKPMAFRVSAGNSSSVKGS
jgi:hypothetical protein